MNKICIFTGTRAEYGLLYPLMKKIKEEDEFELQIMASGMHLSPEFGLTYKEIEKDGFKINEKIEILLSSDSSIGINKSIGLGLISFSETLKQLNPDILIILGDRFEALSIAIAAYIMKIPIAHLHGGEKTEGVIDEGIRHSITKMSYLHFTSTEEYRRRVIQLGENPERVFNVGAIGLDNIRNLKLLDKEELEKELNFELGKKNILFTYHPVTLDDKQLDGELKEVFEALKELVNIGYKIIITKSNADEGGRRINKYIDEFSSKYSNKVLAVTNLGTLKYLSTMKYVDLVMGNSSSGIIEAPSFKIPTVNIGERQRGRVKGNSIIDVKSSKKKILEAVKKAERVDREKIINPYDQGGATEKIYNILKDYIKNKKLKTKKEFFDIDFTI
ncbi:MULTISPECIES: UDP-N-acetylglucosamine 2-epimerase [unclassified Thermosipho (in: thermotogales)]|uniref:UDP-N-acetylglucosamine 2-epimerase n=1 Tax=unclassified Thermosipho (in: thermotogales) TaxID=2676525 RepID=UPI0009870EBA|nr:MULTISPECIES: UDP-N-acetylglucosamine 2-epimerase [unclassified Thermosipho (in: thermotogales)]MBT1247037.1 UDP-N-acetyl glucosamine 2-epimerase [Thermosipho sp. 1244]OOC46896.1 UDP-N-acetylglucosamine 2-epimerase [Thermosipho sp. 1223]